MKNGRFQAKDIDDVFFLRSVDWCQMCPDPPVPWKKSHTSVYDTFPHWVNRSYLECLMPIFPPEVILSKARSLIARGLMTGCDCGCRGDFELTDSGRQAIRDAGFEVEQDRPEAAEKLAIERQLASIDWTVARYEVVGLEGSTLSGRLTFLIKT